MSINVTEKEIKVLHVTFSLIENKGLAFREDGKSFEINREEYDLMLWDIKKKGCHKYIERDYSNNSFQALMDAL